MVNPLIPPPTDDQLPPGLLGQVTRFDADSGLPMLTVPDLDDAELGPCQPGEVTGGWLVGDWAVALSLGAGGFALVARIPPPARP